eukprot:TRINITY_DN29856_c0_g1_i1.p1 TRINITY_DN29856_c0_g1~~TRINITY_DN29856_c0_g1_i1.p1  ORF type:complete len:594 (+),score=75.52 TRINITY_DN29856_c0_g1_i1:38-1783(+)
MSEHTLQRHEPLPFGTEEIRGARANLRPLPAAVATEAERRQRIYDPFPEQEKTSAPAIRCPPPGCQLLHKICKECHVFTGKLCGDMQCESQCDLASCGASLVDVSELRGLAHVVTGKIDGAVYAVAVPSLWNRRLLIYLHGTRPLGAPVVAELNLHSDVFRWLAEDGWMIAATSYRAHGLALTEALEDTLALRKHIPSIAGEEPAMVLLEGHSMGGLAAALLAERHPELFCAAIGIGSAFVNARLDIPQNRSAHGVAAAYANESREHSALERITYRPLVPLLLLVNVSEMSPAVQYAKRAWKLHDDGDDDVIVPAVWVIRRAGHVAVNSAERLNAILHAASWATHGSFGTCRGMPAAGDEAFWCDPPMVQSTHEASPSPWKCRVTHKAHGEVTSIKHTGAFFVSVSRNALDSIGVTIGKRFYISVGEGPHAPPFHVLLATLTEYPYKGVESYSWFGEFDAHHESLCMHIRTYEYCHGAKALGVKVGAPVTVEVADLLPPRTRATQADAFAGLRVPGGVLDRNKGSDGKGKQCCKGKGRGKEKGCGRSGTTGAGSGKGKSKGKVWVDRMSPVSEQVLHSCAE